MLHRAVIERVGDQILQRAGGRLPELVVVVVEALGGLGRVCLERGRDDEDGARVNWRLHGRDRARRDLVRDGGGAAGDRGYGGAAVCVAADRMPTDVTSV